MLGTHAREKAAQIPEAWLIKQFEIVSVMEFISFMADCAKTNIPDSAESNN